MRYAVLDIGTNTVKLLVADSVAGDVRPLLENSETTRLGQGVAGNGRLLPEAIERTVCVAAQFSERARKLQAERFLAFATSAVRDSSNREEFLREFRARTGIECRVISGDEEAELIFTGATSLPAWRDREVIVFDIGGGSMEFIRGSHGKIEFKVSLDCGAVRMTEMFLRSDPSNDDECARLDQWVHGKLRSALPGFPSSLPLLGTGGTISCLAAMDLQLEFPDSNRIDGHHLRTEQLIRYRDMLRAMPLSERKQIRGLPPSRADIIVAGASILVAGVEFLRKDEITTSARNLRHGAILKVHRQP